jgi:hypothetical protein
MLQTGVQDAVQDVIQEGRGVGGTEWGGLWRSCSADEIAEDAVRLYTEEPLWLQARENGRCLVSELFDGSTNSRILSTAVVKAMEELEERRSTDAVGNLLWSQTIRSADYFSRWIELKECRRSE